MQERHLEPETAKTRTEEKKLAELGDGEPSLRCESCGYTEEDARLHGDHYLCKNKDNPPWKNKSGESGAAQEVSLPATGTSSDPRTGYLKQEVSPPSPEPVCQMCCKPAIMPVPPSELEVRELKAALRKVLDAIPANTSAPKAGLIAACTEAERLLEAK